MGKNVKWKYEPYAFYNKKGIEERLSAMAAEGWFIEKMGRIWKYRKGEPTKRTYNVVYVEDAARTPNELRQLEFVEYCEAAGWKRCFAKKGMLIFYHEGENPVPIETEPEFALKSIHKAMKDVYLQTYLNFGILSVSYIFQLWSQWKLRPFDMLVSNSTLVLVAFLLMALASAFDAGIYYAWRRKALSEIDDSQELFPTNEGKVQRVIADWAVFWVLLVTIGCLLMDQAFGMLGFLVVIFVLIFLIHKSEERKRNQLFYDVPMQEKREWKIKQPWAFLLIMVVGVVFALVIVGITIGSTKDTGVDDRELAAVTYEDFYEAAEDANIGAEYYERESLLLKTVWFDQSVETVEILDDNSRLYDTHVYFEYRYVKVKVDAIYDFAVEKFLEQEYIRLSDYEKLEVDSDSADSSVEAVYKIKDEYGGGEEYLVFWDDAFVRIHFGWQPTEDELVFAVERLSSF